MPVPQLPLIHFQYVEDYGELAEQLFDSGAYLLVSIVPNLLDPSMKTQMGGNIKGRMHKEGNYYPRELIDLFKKNSNRTNVAWIQEGYRHCCERCFVRGNGKSPDPYHEHLCLDRTAQSLEEQIEVIFKGKRLIEDRLGISPKGYCPPNHLYNQDTLTAVKQNEFTYFITRNGFDYFLLGLVPLPAFRANGLTFLAESKNSGTAPLKMFYYDDLCLMPKLPEILTPSEEIAFDLNIKSKPKFKASLSEKLIWYYKKIRDIASHS